MTTIDHDHIRDAVKERYAVAAEAARASCCGSSTSAEAELFGAVLYDESDAAALPDAALSASLGCGNPTLLADLHAGEVVLDLGSGAGIDVLLSARRVAPGGKAYGLDMTPQMLELARRNQAEAGVTNAEFLLGTIEQVPLPDGSVDVIISNCVVNLSPDKDAVIAEAFRVLRPGGRLAISDIVVRTEVPERLRALMGLWTGCVAGALVQTDYEAKLRRAGFDEVGITPTQVYSRDDVSRLAHELMGRLPADVTESKVSEAIDELAGNVVSAFVRAVKP